MMLAITNCFPLKDVLKQHDAKWCGERKAWLVREEMWQTIEEKAQRSLLGKVGFLVKKCRVEKIEDVQLAIAI